jgi:DNA-binding winged helix-turn-helix (wHTH) protein
MMILRPSGGKIMRYAFGNFEFESRENVLLRDGVRLPARPKVLSLLAHLIQRRGRLVYKKELIERLWPDVAVGVTSLSTLVGEIRGLLGDSGQLQALIHTETGRGYRFVAPVRVQPSVGEGNHALRLDDSLLIDARFQEFRQFESALTELARGRSYGLLVSGDAGSGKRHLMEELIAMARGRGFATASGRCSSAADSPPLRSWIEVLRSLLQGIKERRLPALLAPDLLNLIHCDPACMSWFAPGNHHHSAQVRFRILDSVCRYLTTTARGSGSVVVIEDLHWADAGSLLLFDQLLHSLGQAPMMLVGTLCPVALVAGHPNSESLHGMLKSGTVESLLLSPLNPPAIAGLEASLSQPPAS